MFFWFFDFSPCLLPTDWTYPLVYLALSTLATLSSSDLCVSVPNLGSRRVCFCCLRPSGRRTRVPWGMDDTRWTILVSTAPDHDHRTLWRGVPVLALAVINFE